MRIGPLSHAYGHVLPIYNAGMKLANLSKILKCAANDDIITMKSEDNGDTITFVFESASKSGLL